MNLFIKPNASNSRFLNTNRTFCIGENLFLDIAEGLTHQKGNTALTTGPHHAEIQLVAWYSG